MQFLMSETFDVLIVGAGVTGIGTACHVQTQLPGKTFAILEREATFGGTWLTNCYPGARSDSDLYSYAYRFKPWLGDKPVATRHEILDYMREVIAEHGLSPYIRYGHEVLTADWSSAEQLWTLTARQVESGDRVVLRARFLAMAQGYYHHHKGHTPDWPGLASYERQIVHTQAWPNDLDHAGKSVIVIGSGATAATLVPALAKTSGPVTLLQRSPSYYTPGAGANSGAIGLAAELRALGIEEALIYEICRRKSMRDEALFLDRIRAEPDAVAAELVGSVREALGPDYDVATHFTPRYRPWQQRLCYVPGGDLFDAIRRGKVEMVTGEIERFTQTAIRLKSGRMLEADLVVTATGFDICILGNIAFTKDGVQIDVGKTLNYRGLMLSGVPNLTWTFGYLRASWTLRVDLNADFLCRLIGHLDAHGWRSATPEPRPEERSMPPLPWVDPATFNSGYITRSLDILPKRLDRPEWQHAHDYWAEKDVIPAIDLEDGCLVFS
jgi:cation diffusion facilitator CzcD-associated flavoprotein CzcO